MDDKDYKFGLSKIFFRPGKVSTLYNDLRKNSSFFGEQDGAFFILFLNLNATPTNLVPG